MAVWGSYPQRGPGAEPLAFSPKPDRYHMTETPDVDDHEPASNRGPLIALAVVAVLILGGLWLMHVLGNAASTQDCIASGRTNCAPLAPSN
jgi:hypothetical protein